MNEAMKTIVRDVHNHTGLWQARISKLIETQLAVKELVAMFEDDNNVATELPTVTDITGQDFGEPLPLLYAAAAVLEQCYTCIGAEMDMADIVRFYEKRYNELTAPGANVE